MASIEIDSLLSKLEYEANSEVIEQAGKAITQLDADNKKAAVSTDMLSKETAELTKQLDKLETEAEKLRDAQVKLRKEIGNTKPTKDQRRQMKSLGRELAEVGNEARKLKRDLKQLTGAEKAASSSAKQAASAKKQLANAVRKARREMKLAKTEAKGYGDELAALAKGGALLVGAQKALSVFGALAGKTFEVTARFQKLRASLVTVTGSAGEANAAFDRIREFATKTPFQVTQVSEAFIKLKALGLDPSERALKSYGNTASAMGKDLNQIVEAVADASVGEFERLKEFGIKASSQGDKVAFTFRGNTTKINKDAASIQEFLLGIGEVDFAGAMELQMLTLGGALSNLEDRLDSFFLKIGDAGAFEQLGAATGEATALLSDDLAEALADLTDEAITEFRDSLDEVDPETLVGLVKALIFVIKVLGLAVEGVTKVVDFFAVQIAFLGEAAESAGEILSDLGDTVMETVPGAEQAAGAWDSVSDALFGVDDAAVAAEASLTKLISGKFVDAANKLANKIPGFAEAQIATATEIQLADIAATADDEGVRAAASQEITRRETEREDKRLFEAGGGEKFKPEALRDAEKGIEQEAAAAGEEAFETLLASGADPVDAQRAAAIAAGARKEELNAEFAATGKAPKVKKKGKKSKKKKTKFEQQIFGQIDKLAEQAGSREVARLITQAQDPSSGVSGQDALSAGEDVRKATRQRLIGEFTRSGSLPPGLQADVRQLARLPSVEEAIGQVAPPVISVTNVKVDIPIGELNVGEGGSFTGSAREIGREIKSVVRDELSLQIADAITVVLPSEVR